MQCGLDRYRIKNWHGRVNADHGWFDFDFNNLLGLGRIWVELTNYTAGAMRPILLNDLSEDPGSEMETHVIEDETWTGYNAYKEILERIDSPTTLADLVDNSIANPSISCGYSCRPVPGQLNRAKTVGKTVQFRYDIPNIKINSIVQSKGRYFQTSPMPFTWPYDLNWAWQDDLFTHEQKLETLLYQFDVMENRCVNTDRRSEACSNGVAQACADAKCAAQKYDPTALSGTPTNSQIVSKFDTLSSYQRVETLYLKYENNTCTDASSTPSRRKLASVDTNVPERIRKDSEERRAMIARGIDSAEI